MELDIFCENNGKYYRIEEGSRISELLSMTGCQCRFPVIAALENNIVYVNQPLNWHRKHEMSAIELLRKKYLPTGGKKRKAYQPYLYGAARSR